MTDRPWLPEHPVDRELAVALVSAQFPALASAAPVHEGRGFDNDVWRFGDVVFRFPRRAIAVPFIETEARVLPALAARLPVAIPAPAYLGVPTAAFAHPFYGHRFLAGTTADRLGLDEAGRAGLVVDLARFLKALHAIDPAPLEVPADAFRGDLPQRSVKGVERLAQFAGTAWAAYEAPMRARLAAPPPPANEPPVLLHGDMYARHLLVGPEGRLAGVIDWGDLCVGDRAVDLAVAYTFLPPALREAFWAAYGPVDAATRERARFVGIARHALYLPLYASDVGDEPLRRESEQVLANALS